MHIQSLFFLNPYGPVQALQRVLMKLPSAYVDQQRKNQVPQTLLSGTLQQFYFSYGGQVIKTLFLYGSCGLEHYSG